jgi:hypothetical protein
MYYVIMSNSLLNSIMPLWSDNMKKNSITLNKKSRKYFTSIYDSIEIGYEKFNKIKKDDGTINIDVKKYAERDLLSLSLYNSTYFPFEIKKNAIVNTKYVTSVTMKINTELQKKSNLKVLFYSKYRINSEVLKKYIQYIYITYHLLRSNQKHNCGNDLSIHIVMSRSKKVLPRNNTTVLDSIHVNSALTTGCEPKGEVLIFRSEEWTKTLIHELFHILGLDFSSYFLSTNKSKLKKLFHINSTYNIYETYSELMATLIHTSLISYKLLNESKQISREKKENESMFIFFVETLLTYETYFSVFQSMKILDTMNIKKSMFHKANTDKLHRNHIQTAYKENTNVFCYYILKVPVLVNLNTFIAWMDVNNSGLLQFKNTQINIENFMYFLDSTFYDSSSDSSKNIYRFIRTFIDLKREDKKYIEIMNTMRMTINDYF